MNKDKTKLIPILKYAPILIPVCALLIVRAGRADPFATFELEILIVAGYIIAVTDIKTRKIPNTCILAMLAAWGLSMIPILFIDAGFALSVIKGSAVGFSIGGGVFLLVYFLSRRGLGGGDVKFMAAAGLFLGAYRILPAMLLGTVAATLTGLTLLLFKKMGRKDQMPLAPFLYAGMLAIIFVS